MERNQSSHQTFEQLSIAIKVHFDNFNDLIIEFKEDKQTENLFDYDYVCKKVLQGYQYVSSGKKNIRLVIQNFYGNDINRDFPILNAKNWNTLVCSMIERQVYVIEVKVMKLGELRHKRVRAKEVQVEFDSDGSIQSAQDDRIKEAITMNTPSNEPYKGQNVVRCHFCQQTNRNQKVSRETGPFYGPFQGKKYAHLLCLLWMSQVFLDKDLKLCNVNKAIKFSHEMKCDLCKNQGASFFCHSKTCKTTAHYRCANNRGWYFNWSNFTVYCPKDIPQIEQNISETKTLTNRQKAKAQQKIEIESLKLKEKNINQSQEREGIIKMDIEFPINFEQNAKEQDI